MYETQEIYQHCTFCHAQELGTNAEQTDLLVPVQVCNSDDRASDLPVQVCNGDDLANNLPVQVCYSDDLASDLPVQVCNSDDLANDLPVQVCYSDDLAADVVVKSVDTVSVDETVADPAARLHCLLDVTEHLTTSTFYIVISTIIIVYDIFYKFFCRTQLW